MLRIDCAHSDAELVRARDQVAALRELAEVAGATIAKIDETPQAPGFGLHECGTARMGADPASSVLDPHNQCWEADGLYVTDAACFPSEAAQNPTLTIPWNGINDIVCRRFPGRCGAPARKRQVSRF